MPSPAKKAKRGEEAAGGGGGAGGAAGALAEIVGLSVPEPSIKDLSPEELRVAEEMVVADVSVRALLTGPQVRLGRLLSAHARLPACSLNQEHAAGQQYCCCAHRSPPSLTCRGAATTHGTRSLSSWAW